MGLGLFFLSNFPEATFIQGATSIPYSRVLCFYVCMNEWQDMNDKSSEEKDCIVSQEVFALQI